MTEEKKAINCYRDKDGNVHIEGTSEALTEAFKKVSARFRKQNRKEKR